MQPCAVCGSVSINADGYCAQCGTFRGMGAQQPGGYTLGPGYPGSAPMPPASGPVYPVGDPGYPQPSSAYPTSGPAYPTSGMPGYPTSGGPQGLPTSAPPAGYPTTYPPVPAPPKKNLTPLIALAAVLVVLIGGIGLVLATRGDDKKDNPYNPLANSTTPGPNQSATNSDIDECVVGRWETTSHYEEVPYDGVVLAFTGGKGAWMRLNANGTAEVNYNSAKWVADLEGHKVTLQIHGTVTMNFTARDGTMSIRNVDGSKASFSMYYDGTVVEEGPFEPADDPAKYTCSGNKLTLETIDMKIEYRRAG